MKPSSTSPSADLTLVYDGDCPFCSAYVTMVRLRESVGRVALIDARSDHPVVSEIAARGYDLDEGMIALYGGAWYHGDDCLHLLAMLSSERGWLNRATAWTFRSQSRARVLYPWLRRGRNLTLRLLGRRRIAAAPDPEPDRP